MKRLFYFLFLSLLLSFGSAQTYVELILDASGSMWNKLDDDRYRIVAAKDVLTQFIGGLPDGDLNVGLRVYGSQIAALDEGSCEDTQLFVPMNGVDKAALSQTVQNTTALGATPIAKSLLAAADDFPAEAQKRLIILVTDGEESCGGDLEAVAADLQARGFEIDIRIIGFDLDDTAIQSFQGLGTFENAESAEALAKALDTAVQDIVSVTEEENDCSSPASISSPLEVEASYPFTVTLQGPEGFVSLHPLNGDAFSAIDSVYPREDNAELTAPSEAATYELRYTASKGSCVIASSQIAVIPTQISLDIPADVLASYDFMVVFEGPVGWIGLYEITATSRNDDISSHYSEWGNPAELKAPTQAGNYEVRYYDSNGNLLGSAAITILEGQSSIEPPASVESSREFKVPFSGPKGWIGLYEVEAQGRSDDISSHYSEWGNPAELIAPTEVGIYEIRYYDENRNLIQTKAIEVTQSLATLEPPASVEASFDFVVPFEGPTGWIGIFEPSAASRNDDISSHYSEWGNPAELKAPAEAGEYEVRYYDTNNNLLVALGISITASQASFEPPTEVEAGYSFSVPFSGPKGWIGIFEPSAASRNDDLGSAYSEWDNPATIGAPVQTGSFEMRYYDESNNLLLSQAITVTASNASLDAPTSVAAGSEFLLPFTGPTGWIGIFEPSAASRNDDISSHYSDWGNPAELTAPETPGSYELRYYSRPDNGQAGLLLSVPVSVQ